LTDQALIAGAGRRRIGLLGGSFNPAHDGHLHISRLALERLGLEELWWLVSPQNPLKAAAAIAPLDTRMETARRLAAADRRIVVTDIEARLGTRYTADTLAALKERVPQARLVLIQLPKWKRWTTIMDSVPVAVFGRPTYALRALAGKAAQQYARYRLPPEAAPGLADRAPPAWVFIIGPMHPGSATAIRAAQRHKDERN
jgi:nicotinate-nucleotide adenylyltransferase